MNPTVGGVLVVIAGIALLLLTWMMGNSGPEPCSDPNCEGKEHRCPSCGGYGNRSIDWENPDAGELQCEECNGVGSSPCPVYVASQESR